MRVLGARSARDFANVGISIVGARRAWLEASGGISTETTVLVLAAATGAGATGATGAAGAAAVAVAAAAVVSRWRHDDGTHGRIRAYNKTSGDDRGNDE